MRLKDRAALLRALVKGSAYRVTRKRGAWGEHTGCASEHSATNDVIWCHTHKLCIAEPESALRASLSGVA